jgi:hypothetical protein
LQMTAEPRPIIKYAEHLRFVPLAVGGKHGPALR